MKTNRRIVIALAMLLIGVQAFAQEQTVRAFSHRGGRMENDENTLEAFIISRDLGYHGYETDIRMTSDGVLVVTHDETLDRTTNGSGVVEESTWADLQKLDTKGGHKLIRLEQLMEFLEGQTNLYVEFELKTKPVNLYPEERLEEYCDKLWDIVMANEPEDGDYLFTSSDQRGLKYLKEKHPEGKYLVIFNEGVNDKTIAVAKALGIPRIGCMMEGTTRKYVDKAKKEGLTVSLWPTHKIEDFVLGIYLGSDYLCTDIPEETMRFMAEKMPWVEVVY